MEKSEDYPIHFLQIESKERHQKKMSTAKECEKLRGAAEVKLNIEVRKLRKAVEVAAPNERTVSNYLALVNSAHDAFIDAHVGYVLQSRGDLNEERHVQHQDRVADMVEAVSELALVVVGNAAGDGEPTEAERSRNVAEEYDVTVLRITAQVAMLEEALVLPELNILQHEVLTKQADDLNELLLVKFQALCVELRRLKPNEAVDLAAAHTVVFTAKIPQVENIKARLRLKKPVPAPPAGGAGGYQGGGGPGVPPKRMAPKMKPLDPPSFNGKARDYARFKERFEEMITPNYDQMAQLEFLERALPAGVKSMMSMIRKTPDQIWEQLNAKYDDPKVVVQETLEEVRGLDAKKLGDGFITKLSVTLTDAETLLDVDGNGEYLRAPSEVARIQDLLPKAEKLEYIRRSRRYIGTEFAKLKEFLMERKEEEEAMRKFGTGMKDVPDNKKDAPDNKKENCGYCSKPNHSESDCFTKQRDQKAGKDVSGRRGQKKGECWNCSEVGHLSKDCPKPVDGKGRKAGKQEVQSNHLRTADCPRCKKAEGAASACAGCGKDKSALKHCLAHCPRYVAEGVAGKAAMVLSSNSCVVCLHPGHKVDSCYDKDNAKRVCGLDGCRSHHHPTLHGARDASIVNCNAVRVTSGIFSGAGSMKFERCNTTKVGNVKLMDEEDFLTSWQDDRRRQEMEELQRKLGEDIINGDQVLMMIQTIQMIYGKERKQMPVTGFHDPGSTCSLILNKLAESVGLIGTPVTITIATVNGAEVRDTKLYMVELLTVTGERKLLRAFGVDKISGELPYIIFDGLKSLFSQNIQDDWDKVVQRPAGPIQLLIGAEKAGYTPERLETREHLVILKSLFGTGYVVFGTHESIKSEEVVFTEEVQLIRQLGLKVSSQVINGMSLINMAAFKKVERVEALDVEHHSEAINMTDYNQAKGKNFMEAEALGVEAPRRCDKCRGCSLCSFRGHMHTEKETLEYKMLEESIKFDPEKGVFVVQYPFIDDPHKFGNNVYQVIRMGEKQEDKLDRDGCMDEFNGKFQEMLTLGSVEEVSQVEMDGWSGPVHYISMQHVINEGSTTTRLRIVINSSLKCSKTQLSLNDMLPKGPNVLKDIWDIFIRHRSYRKSLVSDITKAYHSLLTGLVEKHTRRVVWRFGRRKDRWRVFAFVVVTFGDRPAGVFLEIAIRITCQVHQAVDPQAALRLETDMFVDDLVSGGEEAEVKRFMGEVDLVSQQFSGTMPEILRKGGFRFKTMLASGEVGGDRLEKLGGAVLGTAWDSGTDMFSISLVVNVSKRRRGAPTEPDITVDTIKDLQGAVLTKRICLSVTNSPYDLSGVLSPLTIRLKVLMKKMYSKEYSLGWDQGLPEELRLEWVEVLKDMVGQTIEFHRSIMPMEAYGKPVLAVFWDGSDVAFSAAVYAIWKVMMGQDETVVEVRLVASKARVASDWDRNTPRQELNGAVVATRVTVKVVRAMQLKPEKVWICGDSETILASREKNSGYFTEWFGNRIGETHDNQAKIEEISPVGEWYHLASAYNMADRPSRLDSKPRDIGFGSEWQEGKDFLKKPRNQWPLERNFAACKKDEILIPREEVNKKYRHHLDSKQGVVSLQELVAVAPKVDKGELKPFKGVIEENMMGPEHKDNTIVKKFNGGYSTNDWKVLIKKTSYLFQWCSKVKNRMAGGIKTTPQDMAVIFWINVAMSATRKAYREKKLTKLTLWEKDGMMVVSGRASQGLKYYFGAEYLPVLMAGTRTAELIMLAAHCEDHSSRDVTLATATVTAWIVGGRVLAGRICNMCIRCRFLRRVLEGQKMAPLPPSITLPAPPFYHTALDLFGPLETKRMGGAKATRGKQSTFKCWGVIFLCLNVKAVKIYVAAGYSTADFMMVFEQFMADHGRPASIHSDRGSNLVSAAKEVDLPELDWEAIEQTTGTKTRWVFCPAGSQFRNGAVERMVGKAKRTIKHTYGDKLLTFQEMETAMKRVSHILNSRPISATSCRKGGVDPDFLTSVTPNMMLIGRANADAPLRDYTDSDLPLDRLKYVSEIESLFWNQFKVQEFEHLVPTWKWQEERRSVRQGDVVLVWYSSKSKSGEYRLGRVVMVELDEDGLVRTCIVRYSLVQHIYGKDREQFKGVTAKYIRLAIQRLVLILPVEEQQSIPEVSEKEVEKAKEACGVKEVDNLEAAVHAAPHNIVMRSNMVKAMLKQKGEFDLSVSRISSSRREAQFQGASFFNSFSQVEDCCGLCEGCRADSQN